MPVATRMVMADRAIPSASRVSRMGGSIKELGQGRVMSLMTTHAFFRPRTISFRGGDSMGFRRLSAMALIGFEIGSGSDGSRIPTKPGVSSISTGTPSAAYFKVIFTAHPLFSAECD